MLQRNSFHCEYHWQHHFKTQRWKDCFIGAEILVTQSLCLQATEVRKSLPELFIYKRLTSLFLAHRRHLLMPAVNSFVTRNCSPKGLNCRVCNAYTHCSRLSNNISLWEKDGFRALIKRNHRQSNQVLPICILFNKEGMTQIEFPSALSFQ